MSKTYLVWKDSNCNGKNVEWIRMNGKEFISFIRLPENKDRYFIRLDDPTGNTDIIFIETTKEEYDKWKYEYNQKYRNESYKKDMNYSTISIQEILHTENSFVLESQISDDLEDVEKKASINSDLKLIFDSLTECEKDFLKVLYEGMLNNENVIQISKRMGISQSRLRTVGM